VTRRLVRLAAGLGLGLGLCGGLQRPALGADDRALYRRHCAVCHGDAGRGDGPASFLLTPRPRDFTTGRYKFRSTPTGSLPTVADVAGAIRRGLPGTSMPGYEGLLAPAEIERLARYVLALAPPGMRPAPSVALGAPTPAGSEAAGRGQTLYVTAGCADCHGADGRASGWRPEREGPGGPPRPTDLTEPWTFRGGSDTASVVRTLLTGLDGSPMPAYAGVLATGEAWDLVRYLETLARVPIWRETDAAAIRAAGVARDPLERGRYLANAMLCALCHTPISPLTGAYDTRYFLAGGMRASVYPWGVWYARNLTPDAETGLGAWSEAEIVRALTRGITRDGRRLDPMAMPWPWFSRLTEADARAIAVYLKALPPTPNAVPPAEQIALAETVGGKLMTLLGAEVAAEFWGGNAATEPALRGSIPAPVVRRFLAHVTGWGTLGVGLGVLGLGVTGRRRRGLVLGAGASWLVGWALLAVWPPLGLMSPETTTRWLLLGTPTLPGTLGGAERARAERGEYLATVSPCGLCHTPASPFVGFLTGRTLAGGMEARWYVYGSAVSTNLTPHYRDGIGGARDETLARAMGSGIGGDGRSMHWQAMPWDIGSHWSVEDQRAIIAYLRALPPIAGGVPKPRGPRSDDPPADAFFFGDAARRSP
jgi:mono/diheme cytochrome c family protein